MRRIAHRRVYEVVYLETVAAWIIRRRRGRAIGPSHARKDDAVEAGARRCRRVARLGGRAQLVVRNKDGSFGFERTYPDETPRRKG